MPAVSGSAAITRPGVSRAGSTAGRFLVGAGRWLLLAALVFAPWAYGATRPWTREILSGALLAATGLGLAGCLLNRSWPRLAPVPAVMILLLLGQGWWMTLNAGFTYDDAWRPHPRAPWLPGWPGALDHAAARPAMTGVTAMLGALVLAAAAGESRRWRKRLWLTMALTGCSIIVLGLAQKFTQAPGIFWKAEGHAPTFFGTFRYHANAGSFINIAWPLCAALMALSLRRQESPGRRIFWSACFVVSIAGALVNTSRASGVIALFLLLVWVAWLGLRWFGRRRESADPAAVLGIALLLAAVVFGVHAAGGFDRTLGRWQRFHIEMQPENSRLMVARVCLEMLPHSGWLGFGPGNFRTAFPFFNKDTSGATRGVWLQAHQDYLQTLVEWGWLGAACWAVLIGGGFLVAARAAGRSPWSARDRFLQLGASAAIGAVLLHALVDFPLQIASLQLYTAVLLGLLWSARQWGEDSPPR